MSDVADGPETSVIGRPSRAAGASAATASGTAGTTWSARTTQTWWSGTSVSARGPQTGARVEHDRAGLGDRQRAAGEHAVHGVERAAHRRPSGSSRSTPSTRPRHARRRDQRARAALAAHRGERRLELRRRGPG